jgi:hypothetical protein
MGADRSAAGLTALSLIVGTYGAACAADPGDPLRTLSDGAPTIAPADAGGPQGPVDTGFYPDDAPTGSDGPATVDNGVTPVDSGPNDTGAPPPDVGAPPDVGVGAGCASGATVIVLMPQAGQSTANTMNFGTAGAVCVELHGSVHQGWGVSNGQGRMLTLISATGTQGPIDASGSLSSLAPAPQAGADGFVYWNFTAGTVDYTSVYIF